jgi:cell division protein ZapA
MAQVTVSINGRNFDIACDDGQEQRVGALARDIDRRVAELARSVGQVGENRLLLMAGLIIADELAEARDRVTRLEADRAGDQGEAELTDRLDRLASRVEAIAARLSAA